MLPETASTALMKYIIENKNDCKHPIDTFLEDLAPTLKHLPPCYQHLVKGKIFSVVQELEGQALAAHLLQHTPVVTLGTTRHNFTTHSAADGQIHRPQLWKLLTLILLV